MIALEFSVFRVTLAVSRNSPEGRFAVGADRLRV
jgi:hypothetical protein